MLPNKRGDLDPEESAELQSDLVDQNNLQN